MGVFQARILKVSYHFLPAVYIPILGIKPTSPVSPILQADSLPSETTERPFYVLSNMFL